MSSPEPLISVEPSLGIKEFSIAQISVKLEDFNSQATHLDPSCEQWPEISDALAESKFHRPQEAWLVFEDNQPLLIIVAGLEIAGKDVIPSVHDYVSILPARSDENRLWAQTPENVSDLNPIEGQLSVTRCLPEKSFVLAGEITIRPMGRDFIVTLTPGQSLHNSR
jgi:hypothetical protein